MRKSMYSKILSMIISASILVSSFTLISHSVLASSLVVGDYVQFGQYYDDDIIWRVINIDTNGNPMLMSDQVIMSKAFDAAGPNHVNGEYSRNAVGSNLWSASTLRQWLNSSESAISWMQNPPNADNVQKVKDTYNENVYVGLNPYDTEEGFLSTRNFTLDEQSMMKSVTHKTLLSSQDISLNDGGSEVWKQLWSIRFNNTIEYGNAYYQNTTEKVFILDFKEIRQYINKNEAILGKEFVLGRPSYATLFQLGEVERSIYAQYLSMHYWIRTPDVGYSERQCQMFQDHLQSCTAYISSSGVRPVIVLSNALINLTYGNGTSVEPYKVVKKQGVTEVADDTKDISFNVGDYVQFGTYKRNPILWRIIDIDGNNNPLLLSDKVLMTKAYDAAGSGHTNSDLNREKHGSNLWQEATLRTWLNSEDTKVKWLNAVPSRANVSPPDFAYDTEKGFLAEGNFTLKERQMISPTTHKTGISKIDTALSQGGSYNQQFFLNDIRVGALPETDNLYANVTDKIFVLSTYELRNYVYVMSDVFGQGYERSVLEEQFKTKYSSFFSYVSPDNDISTWTRTPFYSTSTDMQILTKNTYVPMTIASCSTFSSTIGVRPALALDHLKLDVISGSGELQSPYILNSGRTSTLTDYQMSEFGDLQAGTNVNVNLKNETSSWATQTVESAIAKGLVPIEVQIDYRSNITRLDFCKLAIRCIEAYMEMTIENVLADKNMPLKSAVFTDSNNFSVNVAYSSGVFNGSGGLAREQDFITREEAAAMLSRMCDFLGISTDNTYLQDRFRDESNISDWAKENIWRITNKQIMTGSNNCFYPKNNYTKEQSIATMYRILMTTE